ncbi:hypothetical protein DFH29DRAFT_897717 [Suillus ampliporus]|nr:hypothetical protein DFH29DRAFT_897717 [Suillus ampliporus]
MHAASLRATFTHAVHFLLLATSYLSALRSLKVEHICCRMHYSTCQQTKVERGKQRRDFHKLAAKGQMKRNATYKYHTNLKNSIARVRGYFW